MRTIINVDNCWVVFTRKQVLSWSEGDDWLPKFINDIKNGKAFEWQDNPMWRSYPALIQVCILEYGTPEDAVRLQKCFSDEFGRTYAFLNYLAEYARIEILKALLDNGLQISALYSGMFLRNYREDAVRAWIKSGNPSLFYKKGGFRQMILTSQEVSESNVLLWLRGLIKNAELGILTKQEEHDLRETHGIKIFEIYMRMLKNS